MLLMGGGLVAVPFTGGPMALGAAAMAMGLGNGMGSGLVMVLGADVSPREGRAAFLGVWRLASDVGNSGGPLVLGAVTAAASLASGVWVVGVAGLVGALAMYRWAPRDSHRAGPAQAPSAGWSAARAAQPPPGRSALPSPER
jgi:predicted MFS family arabinose efflux permease